MMELAGFVLLVAAAALMGVFIGRWSVPRAKPAEVAPVAEPRPAWVDRISVDALADPAIIVMGDVAVAANDAAQRLFGERLVGSDPGLTVRHPVVLDALAQARQTGRVVEREISGLGKSTGKIWRLRVVGADDGRILVILDDITQTRLTERMRVDFVANASHELRTPLATLSGFIETLKGPASEDSPARQRFLDIMEREAARMSRLIDDLLSLSRIELDKHVRPKTKLTLDGIVGEVGKTLAMRLEADDRHLIIEEVLPLPMVIADRDQILQVLHNLISNALKYGHAGTPITVRVEPEAAAAGARPMVRISVTDVGEGISPEHLPRMTERFYRVDSARSRKMGGTGLGLAIVKHIVERHRGQLSINSRQGVGTIVSLTLPQA